MSFAHTLLIYLIIDPAFKFFFFFLSKVNANLNTPHPSTTHTHLEDLQLLQQQLCVTPATFWHRDHLQNCADIYNGLKTHKILQTQWHAKYLLNIIQPLHIVETHIVESQISRIKIIYLLTLTKTDSTA